MPQGSLRYHDLTVTYFDGPAAGAPGQRHREFSPDKHLEFLPTSGVAEGAEDSPAARCD